MNQARTRHLPLLSLLLLSSVAITGCRSETPAAAEPSRPRLAGKLAGWNVLLLSIDTLRADRLNSYGYTLRKTSPTMDALLARGVLFEEAGAPRAATWPSLATALTGQLPTRHGVTGNRYRFRPGAETLPVRLREAGYQTAAFLANMCQANHQGLDVSRCTRGRDLVAVREALGWIGGEAAEDQPFFLWVHLLGGHGPYRNGGDLARKLDPDYAGFVAPKPRLLNAIMSEGRHLDEADLRHLNALYDAAVRGTDGNVATLLRGLRSGGFLERTLVVFLADHGEELYEHHRYLYHACSVYQTGLHVPLGFIADGVIPAGERVAPPVGLGDVTPTVLDLLGLPQPEALDGVSLVPYLERPGATGASRPIFSEYGSTEIRTVRRGRWKLVDNPDGIAPHCVPDVPEGFYALEPVELYDLQSDPGETRNLAAEQPARVRELQKLLDAKFANLATAERQQLTQEDLRKLRALGYVAE